MIKVLSRNQPTYSMFVDLLYYAEGNRYCGFFAEWVSQFPNIEVQCICGVPNSCHLF